MKISEIRQKSKTEVDKLFLELSEKIGKLNFDLVSGKVKNVREIRETKKDIARIMTIKNCKK
ncbi:MAG: 50S ribosomal protein L29 [Candidatus Nealsonbacteria bacterium]|nr:50S ribosomal protein L29 [Candidatus Nealsonbacteria bacterium]